MKDDQPNDVELVAAVNAGDWSAFETLYFRHKDWAFRLAWRFGGSETDAADAVQEVFVYLAGKFRQTGGLQLHASLTTLLYPAIKHTALALKRKRGRVAGGDVIDDDFIAPPSLDAITSANADLAAVLSGVSGAHREVLLMRFVDDMSLEEIAQALQVPLGTVKSRLHHAVRALREDGRLRRWFEV